MADDPKGAGWAKTIHEHRIMKEALNVYLDYDAACKRLANCAYRYDQKKVVERKEKEWRKALASLTFIEGVVK